MMSSWRLVVEICLPIPIVLLFFLSLPFPKFFRRQVLRFTNRVMSFPLLGGLQLVHIMLAITGMSFAATSHTTYYLTIESHHDPTLTANQRMSILGRKWRGERNFWIAFLAFFAWWMLYCFYRVAVRRQHLEEECEQLRKGLEETTAQSGDKKDD